MRGLRSLLRLSITGIYEDKTDPTQGEGDIVDNKKPRLNASSLPDLGASSYKTNIAKFFRDGRWLLDSSKMPDVLDDWAEDYGLKARQSIATALVRSQGWLVFIDVALDTKEKCSTESTDAEGRRWIASKNMCADLWVWYDDITMSIFPVHMRAKSKFDDIQNENITNIDLADL